MAIPISNTRKSTFNRIVQIRKGISSPFTSQIRIAYILKAVIYPKWGTKIQTKQNIRVGTDFTISFEGTLYCFDPIQPPKMSTGQKSFVMNSEPIIAKAWLSRFVHLSTWIFFGPFNLKFNLKRHHFLRRTIRRFRRSRQSIFKMYK